MGAGGHVGVGDGLGPAELLPEDSRSARFALVDDLVEALVANPRIMWDVVGTLSVMSYDGELRVAGSWMTAETRSEAQSVLDVLFQGAQVSRVVRHVAQGMYVRRDRFDRPVAAVWPDVSRSVRAEPYNWVVQVGREPRIVGMQTEAPSGVRIIDLAQARADARLREFGWELVG